MGNVFQCMDKKELENDGPEKKPMASPLTPETMHNSGDEEEWDVNSLQRSNTKLVEFNANCKEIITKYSESAQRKVSVEDFRFLKVFASTSFEKLRFSFIFSFWAKVLLARSF